MGVMGAAVAAPIALITVRAALRGSDAALEEAARSTGASTGRVLRQITIPLLRPALLSVAVLVFTISLEQLGIPIFLGATHNVDFVASYLYRTWSESRTPDPASVSAGAVLLLITATALIALRRWAVGSESRYVTTSTSRMVEPLPLRAWRAPLLVLVVGYLAVTTIAPVGGVILAAFVSILTPLISPFHLLTLDNFHSALRDPSLSGSIRNSVIVATAGALATTGVIAIATLVALCSFLFVVPPGAWVRNNLVGEGLALAVRGIPLAYMIIQPSLARIATELDDAASIAGAGWWTTARRIVLPQLRPALLGSLLILFVAILNDYEAAVFLAKPGTELMGVEMLRTYAQGTEGPVAALAVVQLAITVVVLGLGGLLFAVTRRRSASHA
jgi:iron(III) transport system permease protein